MFNLSRYRKNQYNITDSENKEIILNFNDVLSPFGEETWKNKRVLNLEIDTSNPDNYNLELYIKTIQEILEKEYNFGSLEFASPYKTRYPNKPHLRTYLSDDINTISKGRYTGSVSVDKVWIWGNKWGLKLIINNITSLDTV